MVSNICINSCLFFSIEKQHLKDYGKLQRKGSFALLIQPFSIQELVYDLMTYKTDCTMLPAPLEFDVNVADFCCRKVYCSLEYRIVE